MVNIELHLLYNDHLCFLKSKCFKIQEYNKQTT